MSSTSHECGPCSLCNRTSTRYFHTDKWEHDKYMHLIGHIVPTNQIGNQRNLCICRACHHDISSNIGNENHIPRWKKMKVCTSSGFSNCAVQGCTGHADVTTVSINPENLPEGITVTGVPSLFCSSHYHYIYNYQHQEVCKICGKKAKRGESFRSCPNPQLTEQYLRATTAFHSIIMDTTKYAMHAMQSIQK